MAGGVGRESRTAGQNWRSSSMSKDFAERKVLCIIVVGVDVKEKCVDECRITK